MIRATILMGLFALPLTACIAQETDAVAEAPTQTEEVPGTPLEADALLNWAAEEFGEDGFGTMKYAAFDLNGDGADELLAYFIGPAICGSGGCRLYMLRAAPDGLEQFGRTTVTRLPIGVLESSTNGYRDVVVTVAGGGLSDPGLRVLRFDGDRYPSNPTVAPAEPVEDIGVELIAVDP